MSLARLFRRKILRYFRNLKKTYYRINGVKIGENVVISMGAWLDCYRGTLIVGDGCRIANGAKILSHDQAISRIHPDKDPDKDIAGVTILEDRVLVGMNAVVLPNVRIGKNSIIGAGTIVSKDVPPNTLAVGNPMRFIKTFDEQKQQWVPYKEAN